jgi:hypothetical protein
VNDIPSLYDKAGRTLHPVLRQYEFSGECYDLGSKYVQVGPNRNHIVATLVGNDPIIGLF